MNAETMSNSVFKLVADALAQVVSDRAADRMVRSALDDAAHTPDAVTAEDMQRVLVGPLLERLSAVMPEPRARAELRRLSEQLQHHYPKAPTLFPVVQAAGVFASGPAWDTSALGLTAPPEAALGADDFEWDEDDFEFDDPEEALRTAIPVRRYALDSTEGQEALLSDLARQRGVQGVVICDRQGRVLRSRLSRGAQQLGTVVAATALLLGERRWRVLSAELGEQTVCMRPLGGYFVALLATGSANLGRLIAELGALQEAA